MLPPLEWSTPPRDVVIGPGQCHLWRFRLEPPEAHLWDLLSSDELERAQRYRFSHHEQHFVAGRATLRQILSHYLGLEPGRICFIYSGHGRPALDPACLPDGQPPALDFSLAHSEDRALLAVGLGVRVGVDLERIDPDKVDQDLLSLVCSPGELRQLTPLSHGDQVTRFYRCWTCKEAYLKARGEGLILPMSSIAVLRDDGETLTGPELSDAAYCPGAWSQLVLTAWPGFAAALVWASRQDSDAVRPSLRQWEWRSPA